MSFGYFENEEGDIVRLVSQDGNASGWINVGSHAVRLEMVDGDLVVEVYPRTNEVDRLAAAYVSRAASVEAGGVDPDHD